MELIDLAREADRLTAMQARSGFAPGSDEYRALTSKLFESRMALVQSEPLNDLDLLMLAFAGRQAVGALRQLPLDEGHDRHRAYWLEELDTALIGMQRCFEQTVGHSVDDLGFFLRGGTSMN